MLRKGILAFVLTTFVGGAAFAARSAPVSSAKPGNFKNQPVSSAKPGDFDKKRPGQKDKKKPVSSAKPGDFKNQPVSSAKPGAFKHGMGALPIGPQHFDNEPTYLNQGPSQPVSSAKPGNFKRGKKS